MSLVKIEKDYTKLCEQMLETPFVYFVGNDVNRYEDGADLRRDYEDTYGEVDDICEEISVMEVLVKLAIRCDEDVMYEPEYGFRVDLWFWEMISALGLTKFNNHHYDFDEVEEILYCFNERTYGPDGGKGCAFIVNNPKRSMVDTEMWYQMMDWLMESYPEY